MQKQNQKPKTKAKSTPRKRGAKAKASNNGAFARVVGFAGLLGAGIGAGVALAFS